jgi:1,4-alpha-glucan branching enzyme
VLHKQWTGEVVEVRFVIDANHPPPVSVAGEFNHWDLEADPFVEDGEGQLVAVVRLEPGRRYQFRYRDGLGRWFNDDAADDYCDNEWGGVNGVVET